jgi:hypothetical protein
MFHSRRHAALAGLLLSLSTGFTPAMADGGWHGGGHERYDHPFYVGRVPHDHRIVVHSGVNFYFSDGWWYRPYGPRYMVVRPPVGIYVDDLPRGFETVVVAGLTYYLLNDVYYRRDGDRYLVVDSPVNGDAPPPPVAAPNPPAQSGDNLFVYPKNGQSTEQQAKDRYECHRWAVQQTGYDPTLPLGGVSEAQSLAKRNDYRRAMMACLNGRGYSLM